MDFNAPMLKLFEKCAGNTGCEICRLQMAEDCLFFPELYRLNDLAMESDTPISSLDLKPLIHLCTLCGLCPCRDVRDLILQAKAALAENQKWSWIGRMLFDAERSGRWGTRFSTALNPLAGLKPVRSMVKKTLGIHPERDIPIFPEQSFFHWAKDKGVTSPRPIRDGRTPRVAYFAGCSAGYFFPEVGMAAVELLEQSGVEVFVPLQSCCGMPLMMEGERKSALDKIRSNLDSLLESVQNGYDLVCSCPTCGYFFKKLLPENAWYSTAFQQASGCADGVMTVPLNSGDGKFTDLPKSIYQALLKDNGYFSAIDPLKRIKIASQIKDLGEYLRSLQSKGKVCFDLRFQDLPMAYFAPCHLREQGIGQPYHDILEAIPGADIVQVGKAMDCCGMGGHLGYKSSFHAHSVALGKPLFDRLLKKTHRALITDCLSCRLQFNRVLTQKVFHPIEVLKKRAGTSSLGKFSHKDGHILQYTESTHAQRNIMKKLKISIPKRVKSFTGTP